MTSIARFLSMAALLVVVGYSVTALAATDEIVTPASVGCFETGECYVVLTTNLTPSNTGCTNNNQIRFMSTQPGAEFMYRAALSAFLSGKKLLVHPSGLCISTCPRPTNLQVQN